MFFVKWLLRFGVLYTHSQSSLSEKLYIEKTKKNETFQDTETECDKTEKNILARGFVYWHLWLLGYVFDFFSGKLEYR